MNRTRESTNLAALVVSSGDAIYSKTLDGIITSWNEGAKRIYGYEANEIVGKHVSILTPPGDQDDIPHILARLRKGEWIEHYETIRIRKDGTPIRVSLTVSPIKTENGDIVAASTIARDITERARLTDLRSFLASIIDSSDDAILTKDLNGIILSWNPSAERLYGYTAEEMIGNHVSVIAPPEAPDEIPSIMERLRKGQRINHHETVRLTKDGKRVDVSLSISPVWDDEGKLVAASAIARDISARKRMERERAQLIEELRQSLNQKDILLQEVYHRVKNNLQVVSSVLDLRSRYLARDPSKAAAAFKDSIERVRAMALVHEKLYRAQDLQKLNFAEYTNTLIEQLLRTYAIDKKIDFKISGSDWQFDLNTAIPLGLIFNELVTNSLKYAFASKQDGFIEIQCNPVDGGIQLCFSDDGPGLPDEIDFETSETFGFRIIRLLAQQINGTVTISPGKGAIFQITILKRPENFHSSGS